MAVGLPAARVGPAAGSDVAVGRCAGASVGVVEGSRVARGVGVLLGRGVAVTIPKEAMRYASWVIKLARFWVARKSGVATAIRSSPVAVGVGVGPLPKPVRAAQVVTAMPSKKAKSSRTKPTIIRPMRLDGGLPG